MATLYIEEYATLHFENGVMVPAMSQPITNQKKAIGSASAGSTAVTGNTRFVLLISDVNCQYAIGAAPTASATSRFLPGNVPMLITVDSGDVIANIEQQ